MKTNYSKTICVMIVTLFFLNNFLIAQPSPGTDVNGTSSNATKYEGKYWSRFGNSGITSNIFGTFYFAPINIYTNSINTAQFSAGSNNFGSSTLGITFGDGLRIINPNPSGGPANLELWADNGQTNGTHIRFDGSGLIQGATTRFEMIGNYNGGYNLILEKY